MTEAYRHSRNRQKSSAQRRSIRKRVLERDGHRCVYCGSGELLTMDHVVPKIRGGGFTVANLVTACSVCNKRRGGERWYGPIEIRKDMPKSQRLALERIAAMRWSSTKPGPDGL